MSHYSPYKMGQNPEIDNIITKVIVDMKLQNEVDISKLDVDESSGKCNIGIFLLNYGEANRNQWIIKIESEEEDEEYADATYPDIQTINAFKSKYPEIHDIVLLPILVEEVNKLQYSVVTKAHGRSLYDIRKSYSAELKRPSFYEFDSYDSYVSEIEWQFEQDGASMTFTEVEDSYFRFARP